jgi:hypothetical protein
MNIFSPFEFPKQHSSVAQIQARFYYLCLGKLEIDFKLISN